MAQKLALAALAENYVGFPPPTGKTLIYIKKVKILKHLSFVFYLTYEGNT